MSVAMTGYAAWLAAQRNVTVEVVTEVRFSGNSPLSGLLTTRSKEFITRNEDLWTIRQEREDFDLSRRKLKPKVGVDFKVDRNGSATAPRKTDGSVDENVIVDPETGSEKISLFLTADAAFLFGAAQGQLTVQDYLRRGELTAEITAWMGKPAVRLRSNGRWGLCELTLDPDRGHAPLLFRQLIVATNLIAERKTLGERTPNRSPFYLPEPAASVETTVELSQWSPTSPYRASRIARAATTTYTSGKRIVQSTTGTANYAPSATSIPAIPAGTPAIVHREQSGVEYVWNGTSAVPDENPEGLARLKRTVFANRSGIWVFGSLLLVISICITMIIIRRRLRRA